MRDLPARRKQREVLHAARADLNHVCITLDQIHAGFVHSLSNDFQSKGIANFRQYFQSFLAKALKRIGRGSRFEGAAAKEACPASPDRLQQ